MTEELQVEYRDPRELVPNPLNFRTHPEFQRIALADSIEDHGWLGAVLFNKRTGRIIDGHARVEYALENEIPSVPCFVVDVDESEERRILARLDKITSLAQEDESILAKLLAEISNDGYQIPTGYDDELVSRLLATVQAPDPFEPTEKVDDPEQDVLPTDEQVEKRCEQLDIWRLGRHYLMVSDSTNPAYRKRLFRNEKIDVVHADPPYGIGLKPTWTKSGGRYEKIVEGGKIEGDDTAFDPRPFIGLAPTVLFWGANHFADKLPSSSFWICWDKQGMELHRDHADCEFAWVNLPKPARVVRHVWDGFRRDSEKGEKRVHAAQKPVDLMVDVFQWLPGNVVFEPFAGSGSTLLACEKAGKTCYAMELMPEIADMVLTRYERMTGDKPELIERGA